MVLLNQGMLWAFVSGLHSGLSGSGGSPVHDCLRQGGELITNLPMHSTAMSGVTYLNSPLVERREVSAICILVVRVGGCREVK